jgi:hypothetical protein
LRVTSHKNKRKIEDSISPNKKKKKKPLEPTQISSDEFLLQIVHIQALCFEDVQS